MSCQSQRQNQNQIIASASASASVCQCGLEFSNSEGGRYSRIPPRAVPPRPILTLPYRFLPLPSLSLSLGQPNVTCSSEHRRLYRHCSVLSVDLARSVALHFMRVLSVLPVSFKAGPSGPS